MRSVKIDMAVPPDKQIRVEFFQRDTGIASDWFLPREDALMCSLIRGWMHRSLTVSALQAAIVQHVAES